MISLNSSYKLLKVNDTFQIVAKCPEVENPDFKYESTNEDLLTVDEKGKVTAVAMGRAYVNVSVVDDKGITQSAQLSFDVAGIQLYYKKDELTFRAGVDKFLVQSRLWVPSKFSPVLSIDNENFKARKVTPGVFEITSDEAGTAKVKMYLAEVRLKKEEIEVPIKNEKGGIIRVLKEVKVSEEYIDQATGKATEIENAAVAVSEEIEISAVEINSIKFTEPSIEVEVDTDTELPLEVDPEGADVNLSCLSDNVEISEGKVKVTEPGIKTVVNAELLGVKDQITLTSKGLKAEAADEFTIGRKTQIISKVYPKTKIEYESSDDSVAKVSAQGLVTCIKEGEAIITVKAGELTKEIKVSPKVYFTPIEKLEDDQIKDLKIFNTIRDIFVYAAGREVKSSDLIKNIAKLYYIKTNKNANTFEYELAMVNFEFDKYQSLGSDPGPEPTPDPEPSPEIPEDAEEVIVSDDPEALNQPEKDLIIKTNETPLSGTPSIVGRSLAFEDAEFANGTIANINGNDQVVINGGTVDSGRLNIASQGEVYIDGLETSGNLDKGISNAAMSINTNGKVVLKNLKVGQSGYNTIEIGLAKDNQPSEIYLENIDFTDAVLGNNAISIFDTADNAKITIKNCKFGKVSNPIRLSNRSNVNVEVNIED